MLQNYVSELVAPQLDDRARNARPMSRLAVAATLLFLLSLPLAALAQNRFEDRPVGTIEIVFEESGDGNGAAEQFRAVAAEAVGARYSTVKIRDSIEALHRTGKIVSVEVRAAENATGAVDLTYVIKRKNQAERVTVEVGTAVGDKVTEQELLFKLNLLDPGTPISEQSLRENANVILEYLRDRGYFNAEVTYRTQPLRGPTDVAVTFNVAPGTQAKVVAFNIDIKGFDNSRFATEIKLKPGELFSRERLNSDLEKIRSVLRDANYLAPQLDDPRVVFDPDKNAISISLNGTVGPRVEVSVDAGKELSVGDGTRRKLLPIEREGTLGYAAIVEGERRLENYLQEKGYFFADVTPVCAVDPPFTEGEASSIVNDTEFLCSALGSADLTDRKVRVVYRADLNRKFQLVDIRLRGTDLFTIDEIMTVLRSQEANILGYIPIFGYGRGLTSDRLLEEDAATIRSLLRELGYRDATVSVNRGVAPTGDDLIVTFVVEQGPPTVVNDVEVAGNSAVATTELRPLVENLVGRNYSRARTRNAERRLAELYSERGYFDARITSSMIETGTDSATGDKLVKVVFNIENEGKKVFINRVLVTGNDDTKSSAILRAVTLKPNELLRRTDVYQSEQNLYSTDAFERVDIKPTPAGERPGTGGEARQVDVIIGVTEQAPRLLQYGGGYSTDLGANGFFDIRHVNLFGRLWQGGARVRWSQRQQLVQFDYINPRFIRDGKNRFAPLTVTAQYQRDSTVTRFFRSAFDQGTFGIVQRIDEDGNAIDEFGRRVGDPTINRLTVTAETNRTIDLKKRSVVFFRYRFEDVRLFNIESLLIKDLLRPDQRVRISGFGATFVRDTRERCEIKFSILETIARGEPGDRCRYNADDPTGGDYLTAEYNVSMPVLGANIGFNKLQLSYNRYFSFPQLRNATVATRVVLGFANVFARGDRFSDPSLADLRGILPISERFFAGGSNTLRGFDFEAAGPRVAIVPQGVFRRSNGESVTLSPFTVPFGGNALAVVNVEGRLPLNAWLRAVPFYDGGNVFRRVGDIFNPPDVPPNDVVRRNLRAVWTHTVGLGLRVKTPIGGEFGIDYGYLLNPPAFLIPQPDGSNATFRLPPGHVHFRFSQAF
ncbi:MAG: POTRA domain-containing protein [Pyrinomonadaceae bacterium]